jgi:hypothetical protein
MPTDTAVQTPVEHSLRQIEAASLERQQATMQRQQDNDVHARDNPAMRMG